MLGTPDLSLLTSRVAADTREGGPGPTPVLTRALERIGWNSIPDAPVEYVADELALLLNACVHEHRDVRQLAFRVASMFRELGPNLDGGLPPIEAYLPAAEELLRLYVNNVATGAPALVFDPDQLLRE